MIFQLNKFWCFIAHLSPFAANPLTWEPRQLVKVSSFRPVGLGAAISSFVCYR